MLRWSLLSLLLFLTIPSAAAAQSSEETSNDEFLLRINGSDSIDAGERVEVAVVISGNLAISGALTDFAMVANGNMTILSGATVDGTIWVDDGTLTLRDGSRVTADVILSGDARWEIEEGARFSGDVNEGDFSIDLDREVAWRLVVGTLVAWLGMTLLAILGAVVFSGIGGQQLWSSAQNLSSRPGGSILSALAFWVCLGILIIPLALSVIGALAIPALVLVGIIVWFLGYITFGTRLGASMTGQIPDDPNVSHPYLSSIAGVVGLQLVHLIAVGTMLGSTLLLLFGDNREGLAIVFGVPSALCYVILWIVGSLGGGALILRAIDAWFGTP